ncbi:MAG: hypothetical protein ACTSSG_08910 [Candidatus Heimdallarchaeaceae archaeon]
MAEKVNQNKKEEKRQQLAYYNLSRKVGKKNVDFYNGQTVIY